jgi:hypothetical protein
LPAEIVSSLSLMDERETAQLRYDLRAIPRVPIASVPPDTVVKVRGYVSTEGPPLSAPMTGSRCALYCVDWKELIVPANPWQRLWDDGSALSSPVWRERRGCDLILDDGTDRALVRVAGARLSLLGTWTVSRASGRFAAAGAKAARERYIEHKEMKIAVGALLTVFGHATFEADPSPPAPGQPADGLYRAAHGRCVLAASAASPLYIVQELIASLDAVG